MLASHSAMSDPPPSLTRQTCPSSLSLSSPVMPNDDFNGMPSVTHDLFEGRSASPTRDVQNEIASPLVGREISMFEISFHHGSVVNLRSVQISYLW